MSSGLIQQLLRNSEERLNRQTHGPYDACRRKRLAQVGNAGFAVPGQLVHELKQHVSD